MQLGERVPEVAVVGSLNVDEVLAMARLPRPGETVLSADARQFVGGKGANQAVAAARLGRQVGIVGLVGDDGGGQLIRRTLREEGIALDGLGEVPDVRSGVAYVLVDSAGENSIVVGPGANAKLTAGHVQAARDIVGHAKAVVIQMEIPQDAVAEAIRLAEGIVILNPSPAQVLPSEILRQVDVLIPNRSELGVLTGQPEPRTLDDAAALARTLDGPDVVVVTLGDSGALLVQGDSVVHVDAPAVDAIDPTGAGDTFCGALADALVRGETAETAVRWAVRASAIAVTALGAQAAMPTREQIAAGDTPPQHSDTLDQ